MRSGCLSIVLGLPLVIAFVADFSPDASSFNAPITTDSPQTLTAAPLPDIGATQTENEMASRFILQQALLAPIATASAQGRFSAYFLDVPNGVNGQMNAIRDTLSSRYGWTIRDIPPEQLSQIDAQDTQIDGQLLMIPGGSEALSDDALKAIEEYVAKGGDLIILAGSILESDQDASLASADDLNEWLYHDFGVRFNRDIVTDPYHFYQTPYNVPTTDLDKHHFITTNDLPRHRQVALIFDFASSITIADTPPGNVIVTPLVKSPSDAYARANLKTSDTVQGPLLLAVSAENTQTGAHIVLLGSTSLGTDTYQIVGIDNTSITYNSIFWATHFGDYLTEVATHVAQTIEPRMTQILQPTVDPRGAQQTEVGQKFLTAAAMNTATATLTPTPR